MKHQTEFFRKSRENEKHKIKITFRKLKALSSEHCEKCGAKGAPRQLSMGESVPRHRVEGSGCQCISHEYGKGIFPLRPNYTLP